jgi:two-component system chemotaxis response regulator CheB
MRVSFSKRAIPPGARIRVLVVDDSVVVRRLVTHALSDDPALEVAGGAANGIIALERVAKLNPDVITLDIEMPGMDGLTLLRQIGSRPARPRAVVFSSHTDRGAGLTLESLVLGADDYVIKAAHGSLERSLVSLRRELVPKIKQFFFLPSEDPAANVPAPSGGTAVPLRRAKPPRVLAIGSSTGGPAALETIIPQFPSDFPLPVLIVQHMPPLFTALLAEGLQTGTALRVAEARDGAKVAAGTVLIAPGNFHMRVQERDGETVVRVNQSARENFCRPSVDVLFRSVAETYGGAAISAILTGMGQDGLRGAQALKTNGAYMIAQGEATSVVWGMPGAVAGAGLADCVLPLNAVVPEVLRQVLRG